MSVSQWLRLHTPTSGKPHLCIALLSFLHFHVGKNLVLLGEASLACVDTTLSLDAYHIVAQPVHLDLPTSDTFATMLPSSRVLRCLLGRSSSSSSSSSSFHVVRRGIALACGSGRGGLQCCTQVARAAPQGRLLAVPRMHCRSFRATPLRCAAKRSHGTTQ